MITDYLGIIPVLTRVSILFSPNQEFEVGRSQQYHLDFDDHKQIKVFVPLHDIDADCGPLVFISAEHSKDILKYIEKFESVPLSSKLPDEIVYKYFKEAPIVATGDIGDIFFVDTDSCLHYGSRPAIKQRKMLLIQYLTPFSCEFPLFRRPRFARRSYAGEYLDTMLGLSSSSFHEIKKFPNYKR